MNDIFGQYIKFCNYAQIFELKRFRNRILGEWKTVRRKCKVAYLL
jgi:hypothetical protein